MQRQAPSGPMVAACPNSAASQAFGTAGTLACWSVLITRGPLFRAGGHLALVALVVAFPAPDLPRLRGVRGTSRPSLLVAVPAPVGVHRDSGLAAFRPCGHSRLVIDDGVAAGHAPGPARPQHRDSRHAGGAGFRCGPGLFPGGTHGQSPQSQSRGCSPHPTGLPASGWPAGSCPGWLGSRLARRGQPGACSCLS